MDKFISKQNLITAGAAAVAALVALHFTSGRSKLLQGGAAFVAVGVTLPLVAGFAK